LHKERRDKEAPKVKPIKQKRFMRFIQIYPQAPKNARKFDFVAGTEREAKDIALENFRRSQYTASRLYPYGKDGLINCIRTFTVTDLDLDTDY
jgi:hypothetical protein